MTVRVKGSCLTTVVFPMEDCDIKCYRRNRLPKRFCRWMVEDDGLLEADQGGRSERPDCRNQGGGFAVEAFRGPFANSSPQCA
jgi:hypothetical protein